MAEIQFHTHTPKQPDVFSIPYGGGCTLADKPGRVFMRVPTTHQNVQICKTNASDAGKYMTKLLDIGAGEIYCYPRNTPCTPVDLVVGVYPKEGQ